MSREERIREAGLDAAQASLDYIRNGKEGVAATAALRRYEEARKKLVEMGAILPDPPCECPK